jgi:hypothetical protein
VLSDMQALSVVLLLNDRTTIDKAQHCLANGPLALA